MSGPRPRWPRPAIQRRLAAAERRLGRTRPRPGDSPRRRRPARAVVSAAAGALLFAATGCGSDRTVVDVYAASSLTDVFTVFETEFEAANPTVDIRLNLAGSSTLARQINDGAAASVFAPADVEMVDRLTEDPASEPAVYATNTLTLVVPSTNPAGITAPSELGGDGVLTSRCADGVPCGIATDTFLSASGLELARASDESNVRAVLTKVETGEVDAGFVYRTDAMTSTEVIEIPLTEPPMVRLAVVDLAGDAPARDFIDYVLSPAAAAELRQRGFGTP